QLKQLTDKLIDIHSQHQSLLVAKSDFRINVLDSYADTDDELKSFRELYHQYMATHAKLSQLTDRYNKAIREKDYLQFQFDQLEEADLNAGELSELESEEALLNHAEEIRNNLMQSVRALRDADQNCLNTLADVRNLIDNIKPHFSPASDYVNRLESLIIEIKDLAGSFEADAADVHYNPARLEQVRERLNKLNDLLLKHQKEDVEELIKLRDDISKKLLDMDTDNSRINELKAESEKLYTALKTKGDALRKKRQAAIPGLEKKLNKMLAYLGMPDAVFVVDMEKRETPVSNGFDKVDFLFSANRDISPQSIGKVASGGEMSRLMLCLKSIIAQKLRMPSIIFDEIDTGVSGEIAGKMGKMMQNLADNAQVISITHLAQVAALGNIQLHVVKNKSGIQIQKLSDEQRLMEIARMSSGEDVSDAAIEHARILLK
ncbi:MAG: DNA repair protein RecN, partial [Bacteroidales bacterium]